MSAETDASIDRANQAIRRALRAQSRRRRRRARLDLAMRYLDDMLEELEQMNLSGVGRVPPSFEPRITDLVGVLGTEGGTFPPMRTNIAPMKLMDMVFEVQDRVLEARSGPLRHAVELDAAAA